MEENYIVIEGFNVFYKITGCGPSTVLLIHGAVGSTNDFSIQMSDEEFGSLSNDEYTLVAFDLPGYGRSKKLPSLEVRDKDNKQDNKKFSNMPTMEYFTFCAKVGSKLMSLLNFKTYSVCGWNDGARIASLLAINYQSRVDSLLLWGFIPVMDEHSCEAISKSRDTGTWSPNRLKFYTDVYEEKKFSNLWKEYVDYIISTLELAEHFDITNQLKQIKCPTMILHGDLDTVVDYNSHVKPLYMEIYNSEIVQLPGLGHNIHQADPVRFNSLLSTFIARARA